eukprot:5782073-Amphidinium_carterae.2
MQYRHTGQVFLSLDHGCTRTCHRCEARSADHCVKEATASLVIAARLNMECLNVRSMFFLTSSIQTKVNSLAMLALSDLCGVKVLQLCFLAATACFHWSCRIMQIAVATEVLVEACKAQCRTALPTITGLKGTLQQHQRGGKGHGSRIERGSTFATSAERLLADESHSVREFRVLKPKVDSRINSRWD